MGRSGGEATDEEDGLHLYRGTGCTKTDIPCGGLQGALRADLSARIANDSGDGR